MFWTHEFLCWVRIPRQINACSLQSSKIDSIMGRYNCRESSNNRHFTGEKVGMPYPSWAYAKNRVMYVYFSDTVYNIYIFEWYSSRTSRSWHFEPKISSGVCFSLKPPLLVCIGASGQYIIVKVRDGTVRIQQTVRIVKRNEAHVTVLKRKYNKDRLQSHAYCCNIVFFRKRKKLVSCDWSYSVPDAYGGRWRRVAVCVDSRSTK